MYHVCYITCYMTCYNMLYNMLHNLIYTMSCYITWNTCIALTTVIPGISPAAGNGISLSKTR